MRSYWVKIVAGSMGVFAIGMVGFLLFSNTRNKVVAVFDSAMPLTIPLPFDLVPFQVDGERLGSLKELVIHRDGPKEVNWLEVEAELNSEGLDVDLAACQLSIDDIEDFDEHSSFICHLEPPRGYVEFGEIRFRSGGPEVPLFVPRSMAAEFRHADESRIKREHARMYREQILVAEEQARLAVELSAEVTAQVTEAIAEAFGDSVAAAVQAQLVEAQANAEASEDIIIEIRTADSAVTQVEVRQH